MNKEKFEYADSLHVIDRVLKAEHDEFGLPLEMGGEAVKGGVACKDHPPGLKIFLLHNELKREKIPISNVCLGGCTITSKTKINVF